MNASNDPSAGSHELRCLVLAWPSVRKAEMLFPLHGVTKVIYFALKVESLSGPLLLTNCGKKT